MTCAPPGPSVRSTGLAALVSIAVGACSLNESKPVEENRYPDDYKTQILDLLRRQLDDPTNIRDAYVADPSMKAYQFSPRYVACIRFNARNSTGQYAGTKDMAAFFVAGEITQIVDANRELCGNAPYQPFPELQKLCGEKTCKS